MNKFCLILLTAALSWLTQIINFSSIEELNEYATVYTLLLIDITASVCVYFLGKTIARVFFVVQMLFGLLVSNYLLTLHTIPSLTVFLNNHNLVTEMNLLLIKDYIHLPVSFILVLGFCIQWKMSCCMTHGIKYRALVCSIPVFAVLHWVVSFQSPLESLTFAYETSESGRATFKDYLLESVVRRGYSATMVAEVLSGRTSEKEIVHESTCTDSRVQQLPLPDVTDKILMIQVESLGGELPSADVAGTSVMPFIRELMKSSFVLRMTSEKKLGSANSDYEILNTRIAKKDRLYYKNISVFSDSLVNAFRAQAFKTYAYHNVRSTYMERRKAFTAMGFNEIVFKEELEKQGLEVLDIGFGGVISDSDLLDYVSHHIPNKKDFVFVITATMHLLYQDPLPKFASSKLAQFYSECYRTDEGLRKLYNSLPEGVTVIIYGDHRPYWGEGADYVPFIVSVTGKDLSADTDSFPIFDRCEMSHYIRRLFNLPAPKLPLERCTQ